MIPALKLDFGYGIDVRDVAVTLLTFEQQWTDAGSGRTLPTFVTEELHESRLPKLC